VLGWVWGWGGTPPGGWLPPLGLFGWLGLGGLAPGALIGGGVGLGCDG